MSSAVFRNSTHKPLIFIKTNLSFILYFFLKRNFKFVETQVIPDSPYTKSYPIITLHGTLSFLGSYLLFFLKETYFLVLTAD
jgi:hypothetical protein